MTDKQPFYSNPLIPEGINTSKAHPVKTFFKLLVSFILIVALTAWVLGKSGGYLFSLIPFEREIELAELYPEDLEPEESKMQAYLEKLVGKIEQAMDIPNNMPIHVHYVNDSTQNAFATLGGHLFIHRGLLNKLSNENTITMLLAHEVAHVKHRDPIRSLGQELAISTGMALLLGQSDIKLLGEAGLYTSLKFSREMELSCDKEAVNALVKIYGHANGASELFNILSTLGDDELITKPDFFVTHPQEESRLGQISRLITQKNWSETGNTQALPKAFRTWMMIKE
ncbi:MAG: M48 family metallopeptidase [Thiotrichaceae bacterium]|nr:M48 family metallopeptidase [Thiotrichaceae bacterium]